MRRILVFCLAFLSTTATISVFAQGGRLIPSPLRKVPAWVRNEFSAKNLGTQYAITFARHPAYFKRDFNGDGRKDVAIQLQNKESGKGGIAIFHAKRPQAIGTPVTILGAGKTFGQAGDDFNGLDMWELVSPPGGLSPPAAERAGAIRLARRDSTGGGIVYWTGRQYAWKPERKAAPK